MLENHPPIDIEKFANGLKTALQKNTEVEDFQNMGEIEDFSTFSKATVNMTVVSVYIKDSSYHCQADQATITEAIYTALAEHPRCKDIFSLGDFIVAVFDTPFKSDIDAVLDSVGKVKALLNLVNKVYAQSLYSRLNCGIGMNYGKVLLVKSLGEENPKYVWCGDAVSTATNLSEQAASKEKVYASFTIYNNLKETYQKLFNKVTFDNYYEATPVNIAMSKWINTNV